MSSSVRGRPGPRLALPSYFRAISFRCQASRVPGVTIVAICDSARRPSPLVRAASRRRWSSVKKSATAELLAQHPILLAQIVDCLLLLLIHPARDGNQHEPKRVENAHCSTVSWALCIVFNTFDFLDNTGYIAPPRLSREDNVEHEYTFNSL